MIKYKYEELDFHVDTETGKLIIESLDSIRAYASTTSTLQLTLSILESANN